VPDAPENLVNGGQSATEITLNWQPPTFDGGSPILDYEVWSLAQPATEYAVLQAGVETLTYTASGLSQGVTYAFKLLARNAYGNSLAFSNEVVILAA
jgi:hypothetical protein